MDADDHQDLIRRLFFVMTMRLEAAHSLAVEGEGRSRSSETLLELANRIHGAGREIAIVADAVAALIDRRG